MILIKITQKIEYISQLYDQNLISKLNLNNVPCPICGSHSWYVHGSYSRNCTILTTTKINIVCIKCKQCGSAHAILVEGMIPFTSITFDFVLLIIFPHRYHSFLLIFCLPFCL